MSKSKLAAPPGVVGPSFVRNDDRGTFVEVVNEGPWETVIYGSMKKGKTMGEHYHRENRAFFYLMTGRAEVRIKHLVDGTESTVFLEARQGLTFLPFELHTINYLKDSDFMLLKSYRFHDSKPDIFTTETP